MLIGEAFEFPEISGSKLPAGAWNISCEACLDLTQTSGQAAETTGL